MGSHSNNKRKGGKNRALAVPAAVQRLAVQSIAAEASGNWGEVSTTLAQHPELWETLDRLKMMAAAREGKSLSGGRDVPMAATTTLHRAYGNAPGDPTHANNNGPNIPEQPIGVNNVRILRAYAERNPWVRAAVNLRREQVAQAPLAVMPNDPRKPYDKKTAQAIEQLLKKPNELRQNWPELIASVIEDVLVLDRGALTKGMNLKRIPCRLYAQDGGNIKILPEWNGDPKQPRYLYDPPFGTGNKQALRNDECILMMKNPASYRYGLSPVQVLIDTIQRDLDAQESASHVVSQKSPPQVIHVAGAGDQAIKKLKNLYDAEVAGRRQIMWMGGEGDIKAIPLVYSLKDQQWLDWLTYLARLICAIFQISPQQIGLMFDVNRANSETQQEIFEDTGLIPLFLMIESYLNRELLADFAPKNRLGDEDIDRLNLRIVFPQVSEAARVRHSEALRGLAKDALAGMPFMTINEIREIQGLDLVKGGNTLWVNTKTGPMPWLSLDGEVGDMQPGLATGGELGSQDAAGGPDSMADDSGNGAPPNLSDDTAPGDTPAGQAQAAAAASGTTNGGASPSPGAAKRYAPPLIRAEGADYSSGVMVAFMLDHVTANALAIPGGLPAHDMHVTLTYHGDVSDLKPLQLALLKNTVAEAVASMGPLTGNIAGLGRFNAPEGQPTPVIATVDVPGLIEYRTALAAALSGVGLAPASNHGYTPHITLGYFNADQPMPIDTVASLPLMFHATTVVIATDRYTYEHGNATTMQRHAKPVTKAPKRLRRWDARPAGQPWKPAYDLLIDLDEVTAKSAERDMKPQRQLEDSVRGIFLDAARAS